jgi:hypothetical protein
MESTSILNNNPDIILCDNKKGTCMLIHSTISGYGKKMRRLKNMEAYNSNTMYLERENKSDTSTNGGS